MIPTLISTIAAPDGGEPIRITLNYDPDVVPREDSEIIIHARAQRAMDTVLLALYNEGVTYNAALYAVLCAAWRILNAPVRAGDREDDNEAATDTMLQLLVVARDAECNDLSGVP